MASIKPFAALRPKPQLASQICELPYDVMSSEEARQIAAGNPLSFLHVSKPEIDLPPGTDLYSPAVYARGKENFRRLISSGSLARDAQPCFYLYRQVMGRHTQTGLVAAASCRDYLQGIIRKHEFTRPDKEDDRVKHIETLGAQTGPVFLVYRASKSIDDLTARYSTGTPQIDFTAADGVRHSAWVVANREDIEFLESEFARMPSLYIADGHHRSAAAARVWQSRNCPADDSAWFLSVIFPDTQVQILPYNRVLKDLNGHSPAQLLKKLETLFTELPPGSNPRRKHEVCLYLEGRWRTLEFRPTWIASPDPVAQLDASLLQRLVLDPIFGITDPRTSKRISFVGGIRGAAELERIVNSGEYACAFAMFPTSIEDLMAIADGGGIMPPKSTWFEPKLRDAMFSHLI